MSEIMEDLPDAALVAAIEANLFGTWGMLGRSPRVEMYQGPDMLRYATGVPFPLMNGVLRARLEPGEVDDKIEATIGYFKARRLPMLWWTGPTTQPADLGKHLEAHGLRHGNDQPGMAVELRALNQDTRAPAALIVEEVEDTKGLITYCTVLTKGFGMPDFVGEAFCGILGDMGLGKHLPWRLYIGRLRGEAVTTSMLMLTGGVAGIYNVATLAEARGQGIGEAMTLAPLMDAREMGYRIGTLQSSEMGLNVYRRLGFKEYCRVSQYVWAGDASADGE
jgi:ribosomal protein S18 acetylase RimI-like enzyme